MSLTIEDIAPPSGNGWKPEVGESVKGVVTYAGSFQRESSFSEKTEEVARIDLDVDGEAVTIWATASTDIHGDGYPKRDAKAIAAAARAAGASAIEVGGVFAMKRVEDVPTKRGPARDYVAQYEPPAAPAVSAEDASDGAVSDLF